MEQKESTVHRVRCGLGDWIKALVSIFIGWTSNKYTFLFPYVLIYPSLDQEHAQSTHEHLGETLKLSFQFWI